MRDLINLPQNAHNGMNFIVASDGRMTLVLRAMRLKGYTLSEEAGAVLRVIK